MSSSPRQQHFTAEDLTMLDRILDKAGIFDLPEKSGKATRMDAARFLIATFQSGVIDESALSFALVNRYVVDLPTSRTLGAGEKAAKRIWAESAGDDERISDGYRYGRRIEADGTWTIFHLFTGTTAEHGAWNMVGLNAKTATRALGILNKLPMKAA